MSSDWYRAPSQTVAHELESNLDHGLTEHEAARRLTTMGANELPEAPPPSPLKIFLTQFANVIVWVLIGAAGVSGLLEEWINAAAIGVAMGITGTDVTNEASDMVVTDDNFASIAAAVEEGRAVFDNIRKAVFYLLSCNISEILLMLRGVLFTLPLPLLPVQILWINLVTDGLPALALAVDPKDQDLMRRPPRSPTERFLTKKRFLMLFLQGSFLARITLGAFVYCLYGMDLNLERACTLTFTILVIAQLFHAFNNRSDHRSLFEIGLFTNKPLLLAVALSGVLQAAIVLSPPVRQIFDVVPFDAEHWLLVLGVGALPLCAMELWRRGWRVRARSMIAEPMIRWSGIESEGESQ